MLNSILPKEEKYFDRFDQLADLLAQASATMMTAVDHPAEAAAKAMVLSDYEVQADQVAHTLLGYLHRTFITPFGRNDIHTLVFKMQKLVDQLSAVVSQLVDHNVAELSSDMKGLAKLVDEQVMLVSQAVPGLRNMKESESLVEACSKICQVKYRSKEISRRLALEILKTEDVRTLLLLKDLSSHLNATIASCVDIAHRLEVIVLEYT
jgi:uncharacterized protein Yka (UPF0111/DUF47 family)